MPTLRVSEIEVGPRGRSDLGDLTTLMESMDSLGLFHPILVNSIHQLIAGERRLEAAKRLGWDFIDVNVAHDIDDAVRVLRAERDENSCREDLIPSDAVALGKRIEELERPAARERQGTRTDLQPGGNLPPGPAGKTRDLVGAAVGMSGKTYAKAKEVVEAAEDESLPPEVRAVAQTAVKQMDETGKVNPAHMAVTAAKQEHGLAKKPKTSRKAPAHSQSLKRLPSVSVDAQLQNIIGTLRGLTVGVESLEPGKIAASKDADEFLVTVEKAARALLALVRKVKKGGR